MNTMMRARFLIHRQALISYYNFILRPVYEFDPPNIKSLNT